MILQNVTDAPAERSKVVVTKNRQLLEIRQGNNTFRKNGPQAQIWNSVADWTRYLQDVGLPAKVECVETHQRPTIPIATPVSQPKRVPVMPAGTVLRNDDHTSKVLVLKSGELLELRRGELTFTKKTLKTTQPRVWKTVDEWRATVEEPSAKRRRSNDYRPAEGLAEAIDLARPLEFAGFSSYQPFPSQEVKNRWVEHVKTQMTTQLRNDMDVFVSHWINKFKIE